MTTISESLAVGFLMAPPFMESPVFSNALILLVSHDESGATGFIVNRTSSLPLAELLDQLEIPSSGKDKNVFFGGPVSEHAGFVLYEHESNEPEAPGFYVSDRISITPAKEVLEAAARGALPGRFELLLGYAGWEPQQLEDELKRGGWMHCDFDEALLFDTAPETRWEQAYASLGVASYGYAHVKGGAQA